MFGSNKKPSDFASPSLSTPKPSAPKLSGASIPNPSKVGSTAVKMPKAKKMPDPFGKPSVFYGSMGKSEAEEFSYIKHPTLAKLKDFLLKKHKK